LLNYSVVCIPAGKNCMAVIVIKGYMYCRTVNCRAGMRILDVISMPRHDKGRL